jgi:hypothetical protein
MRPINYDKYYAILTFPIPKYVTSARHGAAREKINKCLLIFFLSTPSWRRNDTSPNAAGAYKKII